MSATWDDVRQAQIMTVIAASERVHETEAWVSKALFEVERLERELAKANEALKNARQIQNDRIAKVAGYVEDYQHIGEGSE